VQPNYIRVWAGFFTLVIYLRPAAVVGVVVAAGVAYFNLGLSTGSYQLEPEVRLSLPHVEVARCFQGLSRGQVQHTCVTTQLAKFADQATPSATCVERLSCKSVVLKPSKDRVSMAL